jgi:hypothetical protein
MVTKNESNSGIIQSGGSINASQLAVGDNAKAIARGPVGHIQENNQHIGKLISSILQNLSESSLEESEKHEAQTAANKLISETQKPKPDKNVIGESLTTLDNTVKSVSSIAGSLSALKALVSGMF